MKSILFSIISIFYASAFAVNVADCPEQLSVEVTQISAYKSSVNSTIAGWKEANATLAANTGDLSWQFKLDSTAKEACFYSNSTGETVKIFSYYANDEEGDRYDVTVLSIFFQIDNVRYNFRPIVSSLSPQGVTIYRQYPASRIELRTPLKVDGKWYNVDVGLAYLTTK